jgi:transglutaminase-like putative cysteine protease
MLPENSAWLRLRSVQGLVGLAGGVAVYVQFGTLVSRDAGLALFVLMTTFRLLEVRAPQAAANSLFLTFFLLAVAFLYDQSLIATAYGLSVVAAQLAVLHALQRPGNPGWLWHSMVVSGRSLLLALPLAAALFVLFPRLAEPLWRMPGQTAGSTGVSDEMTPGDISSLVLSDNPAFRVRFDDFEPRPQQMYWRALVLSSFDGLTWKRGPVDEQVVLEGRGTPVGYQMILEPTRETWLYALDIPWTVRGQRLLGETLEPVTRGRQNHRITYRAESWLEAVFQPDLSEALRQRYTRLPATGNGRSLRWARELRAGVQNDAAFVQQLLRIIHEENFHYTLKPPLLRQDTVDDFWFNQRKGFCEHYASAFVFMARAAGIPARVVVGYLGGERNPFTGEWLVRQSDAHAWTEVWLPDRGWQRIDPTAAIHPLRIDPSVRNTLSRRASLFADDNVDVAGMDFLQRLAFMWDAANSRWQDWVAGFDQERQRQLLSWMGLADGAWWRWLLAGVAVLVATAMLWWWLMVPPRARPEPLVRLYLDALRLARTRGWNKRTSEGPMAFLQRIESGDPSLARRLRPVVQAYVRWRYANAHIRTSDLVRLRRHLKI